MGFVGGEIGYRILRTMWPGQVDHLAGRAYTNRDKLQVLLGEDVYRELENKVVVDFGCGEGQEAIRVAQNGAAQVIGVDIQERLLAVARDNARVSGVAGRCEFASSTSEKCDVVLAVLGESTLFLLAIVSKPKQLRMRRQ